MSVARTLTFFLVDVSTTMGRERIVVEDFVNDEGIIEQRQISTTDLQWCMEFVNRKAQILLFSGLKTATMGLMTFGSSRTDNAIVDSERAASGEAEEYLGVDEIVSLGQPTVATLELVRALRALGEEEAGHPPDPLDALVCALTSMSDKGRGGQPQSAKSYTKTIYLITNAEHHMNTASLDAITQRMMDDRVHLKIIGVDFDDADFGYIEPEKDALKAENERWWHNWLADLNDEDSQIATAARAIEQVALPNTQMQSSAPYSTALTFGDPENKYSTGGVMHIPVKMYKLTTRVLPMARKTMSKLAEQAVNARQVNGAVPSQSSNGLVPSATPVLPALDVSDGITNTMLVDIRRIYFFAEDAKEHGTDNTEALPEGAEESFSKAYKLGASLIPITQELDLEWESKQGLEIINWVRKSSFRREYLLGDIWNIFADNNNLKAQVELSSLAMAMNQQGKYALVRFVRRANAEPKLGILHPVVRSQDQGDAEYFHFAEVPFSDDLKRYTFPSLDRVITADGKVLKEHRTLPNDKMTSVMEGLVDSMDLMHVFKDENGQTHPWFSTENSFNPGIHRMKEAVAYRVLHPDRKDLPRPHWEVDKYLDRPAEVREASQDWAEQCKNAFMVRYYPSKVLIKAKQKRERDAAIHSKRVDTRYELDLGQAGEDSGSEETTNGNAPGGGGQDRIAAAGDAKRFKDSEGQSQPIKGKLIIEDDSEEEEDDMLAPRRHSVQVKGEPDVSEKTPPQPQTARQEEGREPTRTPVAANSVLDEEGSTGEEEEEEEEEETPINILPSDPVDSFLFHLEDPKMDQGAVLRALQKTIVSLVCTSNSSSSGQVLDEIVGIKAREALRAGKKAAAEYDEAEEWNDFIRRFKSVAVSDLERVSLSDNDGDNDQMQDEEGGKISYLSALKPNEGLRIFWAEYCVGDLSLGLVTKDEDEGMRSRIEREEAEEFVRL